jgi:hypothetical protein
MTPRRGDDNQVGNDQPDSNEGCLVSDISVKGETHQVREEICAVSASSETDKEQTSGEISLFYFCCFNSKSYGIIVCSAASFVCLS